MLTSVKFLSIHCRNAMLPYIWDMKNAQNMKNQTITPALGTRKQMNAALDMTNGGYFAQTTYCMKRMKQVRLFVFPESKVAIEVSNEAYNDFSALCRQSRPLIGAIPCNWMTAGATR